MLSTFTGDEVMRDGKLFLGTFLSIIVECKANHTSQSDVVVRIMRSIDPEFEDSTNNVRTTRLVGGTSNPPNYTIDKLKSVDRNEIDTVIAYFEREVIPQIKENEVRIVVRALCLLIMDDPTIGDDSVLDTVSGTEKKDLVETSNLNAAALLTGVFLYVLKNTKNNGKKGIPKPLARKYVEEARKEQLAVSEKDIKTSVANKDGNSFVRMFCGDSFSSAGLAIIVPTWNEDNRFDKALMEKLTDRNYTDVYEELRSQKGILVTYEKGTVTCSFDESLRCQLARNLDEIHMRKLLNSLSELLLKWSEYDSAKSEALNNACDFLAYYGCCMGNKSRLESNKWENLLFEFLSRVLSDKNGFFGLVEKLVTLVEADPGIFVSVFERKIDEEGDLIHLFLSRDNNTSIVYPLAYSLRKVAAYKDCFAGAMSVLFELTKYSSIFLDNISYVLNLHYLQTEAPLASRLGVIKNFFMRNNEIAWRILLSLLPGHDCMTSRRMDFRYYPIQMIELTRADYDDEMEWFIDLACYNLNGSVKRAIDLIEMAPILSDRNAHLISNFVLDSIKPSEDTVELLQVIEESLSSSTPTSEKKAALVRLQDAYEINREELEGRAAFKFEHHWRKKDSKKHINAAMKYVESLYREKGFDGIISGFHKVEEVRFYCEIIKKVLPEDELRSFCNYLNSTNSKDYLWPLFDSFSSRELVMFLDKDDPSFIKILCTHECDSFLLKYVEKLPEEKKEAFWKERHRIKLGDLSSPQLRKMAESYEKYGNYDAAVGMLSWYNLFESEQTKVDQVIRVLQQYSLPEDFSSYQMENNQIWDIQRLLAFLQEHAADRADTIAELEEKYITLYLTKSVGEVKYVFYKMANHPEYVEKLIIKKHQAEENGNYNSSAAFLLYRFKVSPGYSADGSFNLLRFCTWYDYAVHSELKEEMVRAFGTAAYHANSVDDFFMNRKVIEFIETCSDEELITSFEIEALNSIGPVQLDAEVNVYDKLAKEFQNKAVRCEEEGYIKVSRSFRSVASMLSSRSQRV